MQIDPYVVSTVLFLVLAALSGYFYISATYVSLSIRRALAVPVYRSRALWTAFIGLSLLFFSSVYVLGAVTGQLRSTEFLRNNFEVPGVGSPQSTLEGVLYLVILPVLFVALFVWIDRTVEVLIKVNPLRRDILGWRRLKLRLLFWVLFVVQLIFYYLLSLNLSMTVFEYFWSVFFVAMVVLSALTVGVGSARTKDETFRSHSKWLGYFLLASLTGSIISLLLGLLTGTLVQPYLAAVLGSFFFYRMAKSLAPLNKLLLS